MLDRYECLRKLAARRGERDVVITTMSVAMPLAALSDGPLDFAHVDSAMGHAADFAYGLALAQPERRVIVLNGDGSTLMSLGTLVTIAQRPAPNYTLVIVENGTYEVTGNQPVPGAGRVDFETIARGAGVQRAYTLRDVAEFDARLEQHFTEEGPVVFVWKIGPGGEAVPRPALAIRERARRLRRALVGDAD
ncbi:MAG: thiamine pyrophosphate-dependent enzyme [Gemmatimonadota bacterium]